MDKNKLDKKLFKKCLKITKKYLRGRNTCICYLRLTYGMENLRALKSIVCC